MALPDLEWARGFVAYAHNITAQGGAVDPARVATAEKLMRDAGEDPAAITATVNTPAPRGRSASRALPADEVDATVLGITAEGKTLTVALAATEDPLTTLTAPGVVLTSAGSAILRHLQATPLAHAAALKLDVEGIKKWAQKNGQDFTVALQAAIDNEELRLRDLKIMSGLPAPVGAPAQNTAPVDPLLEKDRQTAARFGLQL